MQIKLTKEESEQYFYNALCNGLGYASGYGLEVDADELEYNKAKQSLKKDGLSVCFEDILIELLRQGGTLIFDNSLYPEYKTKIKLKDVHERVQNTQTNHLMDMVNEQDDAITADVIIQTVLFNEIIFG